MYITARYLKPELLLFVETHASVSSVFLEGACIFLPLCSKK